MIDSIKAFYEKHINPPAEADAEPSERGLQLATAALLIEMTRADFDIKEEERHVVTAAIRSTFGLTEAETETLLRLAEDEAKQATCLHRFTSLVNEGFSREQRIKVIELLWQVAYADAEIEKHEHHLMRKLAGLLHVSHKDYIAAKFRARQQHVP